MFKKLSFFYFIILFFSFLQMFRKYSFSEDMNENINADWNWEDFNQDSNSKLTKKKRSSYFT